MKHREKRNKRTQPTGSKNLTLWIGLALALIVVVIGFVFLQQASPAANKNTLASGANSEPLEIAPSVAAAKRDAGAIILDVRTPAEWNDFHIQGATLIPLDTLADHIKDIPRDREIIVVCRSGGRSAQGRDLLRQAGFTQVTSLSGGLTNWQAQGYPTVSGSA